MVHIPGENQKAESFFSLFMQNQRKIYAYILMLVHNRTDADDIMQETAAILWSKFDQFRPDATFSTWAIGIARNKIMHFRQEYRRSRIQFTEEIFDQITTKASLFQDEKEDYLDAIDICVAKLSDDDQQIVKLRYNQGITIKSIAGHMGRSSQGIYKTMARIHSVLQECLQRSITSVGGNK
ncbi:MAG: sigma-70 family RNA polymerase sigma factor [Phycisphaerae bacterium]|nr:sigma-70 family RNA polymerase sigma factor [Phycisphaerae bacterium]